MIRVRIAIVSASAAIVAAIGCCMICGAMLTAVDEFRRGRPDTAFMALLMALVGSVIVWAVGYVASEQLEPLTRAKHPTADEIERIREELERGYVGPDCRVQSPQQSERKE